MKTFWNYLVAKQNILYKSILILSSSLLILYLFPIGGQFKYEFQKGRAWQYPSYYAPFDFSILKSEQEVKADQEAALSSLKPYLRSDIKIKELVFTRYQDEFSRFFPSINNPMVFDSVYKFGESILKKIYENGVLPPNYIHQGNEEILLIQDNVEIPLNVKELFKSDSLFESLSKWFEESNYDAYFESFNDFFFELITPNVALDLVFYQNTVDQTLQNISLSRGVVASGELIIAEGEMVDESHFETLSSLRKEFSMLENDDQSSIWVLIGYSILIFLTFSLLLLFLYKYRFSIYENNRKLTFIFFNIVFVVFVTTVLIGYNTALIFATPLCILPLIIKAFFDARLGLFAHVLTVLLIGFIVPNSFEFVFLQIVAGIVTIQSIDQLYRRANLFISVGQIVLVYLIAYIAFTIIQEGTFLKIDVLTIGLFLLNGLLMLFVQPLIYIYEKLFGLVSDVSLLELSDTNSKLLKELSDQAPGTFHHSLQVANLAEAAANEIGANTLLVRVGALYHDIGKLKQPKYFSENQIAPDSPHDSLTPKQSAKIIIDHVLDGILIAQKNKLPDRVIDFIRTHHGTSSVYYFYKKQLEFDPEGTNIEDFQYPGPRPFSKETAILMMADAVEAASKSLKAPDIGQLDLFIEKIISGKMEEGQFNASNITLAEIETVKKVLLRKLINVYQLRIEYPE
ncbi:MAG: HDIG domain-containing protein [Flavobacteriaceae bacterium]|nr:HDIG domain-containing protein [Flavobacteriaceae bacterium]MBT4313328.1 HDIG domain-containing protein [Flavobacteriaceae bacterium]MBT5091339.1 HDIG domain-containing protein [Flavobacteriaceae bacterium]MBT5284196.1 HDIG domain-containing protein [Flavobacteriaceae bacterium]MBT5445852.1 HDIG domain-containing protein [Flavobacteriaceae bacterium]